MESLTKNRTATLRLTADVERALSCPAGAFSPESRDRISKGLPPRLCGAEIEVVLGVPVEVISPCKAFKWWVVPEIAARLDYHGRTEVWVCEHQVDVD